jgi:hypothetical protein
MPKHLTAYITTGPVHAHGFVSTYLAPATPLTTNWLAIGVIIALVGGYFMAKLTSFSSN